MNQNKVFLIGRTTAQPELKALPSGVKICSFSLATNRVWKDKNGSKQEETTFHNIIAWGKQAETIAQYVEKGQELGITGRIQNRSWECDDGQKKYRSEVVLEEFQFGSRAGESSGRSEARPASAQKKSYSSKPKEVNFPSGDDTVEYPEEEINASDIPF